MQGKSFFVVEVSGGWLPSGPVLPGIAAIHNRRAGTLEELHRVRSRDAVVCHFIPARAATPDTVFIT